MYIRPVWTLAFWGLCYLQQVSCQKASELNNCRPPSIIKEGPPKRYFIVKSDINIPCIAQGDGKLLYSWQKDGNPVDLMSEEAKSRMTMQAGTGSIVIFNPKASDEGVYQCVVTNNCGTSLSITTLLLHAQVAPFPRVVTPPIISKILGSSAKLTCTPPQSVPKAKIHWILTDPSNEGVVDEDDDSTDLGFNSVPLNNRVTQDYNGNLYITSVRKEDEHNGKTYVCLAQNLLIRSSNKGEDKILRTRGTTITDAAVDLMWNSPTENLVLESKKAKFKCIFSGTPEATITWSRLDGKEMDKVRMHADYHELIIKDVQYEDAGKYKCEGTNVLTQKPISVTFTLDVEAAPKWRIEPRDMTVGVDESASFECDAAGSPEPEVTWYLNGKAYGDLPEVDDRKLKGNTLVFTNLDKEDSQVIQCNASNIYGFIWSDVYLYVEALPPSIAEKPEDEVIMAEGQNVTLICSVKGKPKPTVVWYKGSQPLDSDRFKVEDSGNLFIVNLTKKDSDTYRCIAENRFGDDEAEGGLTVREKTKIVTAPMDQKTDYTNPVTFTCGASTDGAELTNLKYIWMKDDKPIESDSRIEIEGGVIYIQESSSQDTGTYKCVADNGLDQAVAEASLEVKAPPDPPYNVKVNCSGLKAFISWKFRDQMKNFDQMTKYIIEGQTNYKPHSWFKALTIDYKPGLSEAAVELSPFASYSFRVKAVNRMGISEPSEQTTRSCETPHAVPDKNPDDVHTDEQYPNYLVVKWKPMDQIDLNAPNFTYVIEVQEHGSDEVQTYSVDNYKSGEKKIKVNNVYRPYLISVQAQNQVGKAKPPQKVTGYSGEAKPLVVPANFELDPDVNVTATSAGFRWDPVDTSPEAIQGQFSGYKIRFWKKDQQLTTMHEEVIPPTSNGGRRRRDESDGKIRGMVANLPSYAEIEADVVAINKNFASNGSNVVNFSTPEGVPGRVSSLEALARGSHHFQLQWNEPLESNGVILGYQLSYRERIIDKVDRLDFKDLQIARDDLGPEETRATLGDLKSDTQYRIYIRARTRMGLGEEYFIDVKTTSDVESLVKPKISTYKVKDNEVNVSWSVPVPEKGARTGHLYFLEYKEKGEDGWVTSEEPAKGDSWGNLDHLDPGTVYMVRVIAMAQENGKKSQPSDYIIVRTTGEGASRASFLTAAWFIGMMVAIAILILILIIVCIIKRNRGDHYPVQEKERLRGNCDDTPDNFNGFGGKGDENGFGGSSSFDRDAEKVPLDEDEESSDYGDDDGSKFNEDGSFIGQYGPGDKSGDAVHVSASSVV